MFNICTFTIFFLYTGQNFKDLSAKFLLIGHVICHNGKNWGKTIDKDNLLDNFSLFFNFFSLGFGCVLQNGGR